GGDAAAGEGIGRYVGARSRAGGNQASYFDLDGVSLAIVEKTPAHPYRYSGLRCVSCGFDQLYARLRWRGVYAQPVGRAARGGRALMGAGQRQQDKPVVVCQ